ncbi:hypothetical protein WDU94_015433 [Cyamophila willieti]
MISGDRTGRHIRAFQDGPYIIKDTINKKFNIPSNLGFSNLGHGRLDFIDTYNTKCPKFVDSHNKYDTSVLEKNYADTKYRFVECVNTANKYLLPRDNAMIYKTNQPSYLKFTLKSQPYPTPNQTTTLPDRQTIMRKYLKLDHIPNISTRNSKLQLFQDFQLRPMYIGRNHVQSHWPYDKTQEKRGQVKDISPLANHFKCYLPRDLNDKSLRLELPNLKINEISDFERDLFDKGKGAGSCQANKSKILPFKKDKHDYINVSELLDQLRMKKLHKTEAKRLDQNTVNVIQPNECSDNGDKPNTIKNYQFQTTETVIDDELSKDKKSEEKVPTLVISQITSKKECFEDEKIAEHPPKKSQENSTEDLEEKLEIKTSKKDTKTGRDKTKRKKSRKNYMMDRYLNSVELPETQSGDQMVGDENKMDDNTKINFLDNIEEIKTLEEFPSTTNNVKASLYSGGNNLEIVKQSETVLNENHSSNKIKQEDSIKSTKPGEMVLKLSETFEETLNKRRNDNEKLEMINEKHNVKNKENTTIEPSAIHSDENIKNPTEKTIVSEDEFYDCKTVIEDQVSRCSSFNGSKPFHTDNVQPDSNYTKNGPRTPQTNLLEPIRIMPNTNYTDNPPQEEKRQMSESAQKSNPKSNQMKDSSTQYDQGTTLTEIEVHDQDMATKKDNDSKNKDNEENANKIEQNMNNERKITDIGNEERDITRKQDTNIETKRKIFCTQTPTTVYNVSSEKKNESKTKDLNHKSISISCNLSNPTYDPIKPVGFGEKPHCNKYAKSIGIQTKIVEKALKREIGIRTNVKITSNEKCAGSTTDANFMTSSTDDSCYKIILVKKGKREDTSDSKSQTKSDIMQDDSSKSKTKNNIESHENRMKHRQQFSYKSVEDTMSPLRYQYHPKLMSEKKKERSESKRRNSQQCSRTKSVCKDYQQVILKQSNKQDLDFSSVTKKEFKSPPTRVKPETTPLPKPKHARNELRCASSGNLSNKTSSTLMSEIQASLASTADLTECCDTQTRNKTHVIDETPSTDTVTFSDCTNRSESFNNGQATKVRKISEKNVKWTRKEDKNEIDEIDITLSMSCCSSYHGRISGEENDYKGIRSSLNDIETSGGEKNKVWDKSDCIPLSSDVGKTRTWEKCDTDYLQLRDSKKWYHFCFKP